MGRGTPGVVPVAGDWTGRGFDSPGVYRPSNGTFYLSDNVCNCSAFADHTLTLGAANKQPFTGDWLASGRTGVGIFDGTSGLMFVKDDATTAGAPDSTYFFCG